MSRLFRPGTIAITILVAAACDRDATRSGGDSGEGNSRVGERWVVDSAPSLVLGNSLDDSTQLFSTVIGATRLPNGEILVADRQERTFHLYTSDGRRLRSYGRKGSGPGEFVYPAKFWRCGDSVYVYDIDGHRTSVFDLSGAFVRAFRFGSGPQMGSGTPYASACNPAGTFVHFGWEKTDKAFKDGHLVYRQRVPFWVTGADSAVHAILDSFPGSERVLAYKASGQPAGTGPRIFGKQTAVAVGRDRVYIGTADGDGIIAVNLRNYGRDTLALRLVGAPLTPADIDAERKVRIAAATPGRQAGIEGEFASHPFPDSVPHHAALLVDAQDLLWVQEYPRAGTATVRWRVVSSSGDAVGHAELPTYLQPYEIGADYVLGRYVDPIESVPQVRMYRLHRSR
jgi:hypothetical protein